MSGSCCSGKVVGIGSGKDITYTICPVPVGSHVAVEKGWLNEELEKVGASSKYIRSLPQEKWLAHFTHQLPNFFRDGGNIPAIWAKARGEKTKLIGLTFSGTGGRIIVNALSGINKFSDLKGKRIGLSKRAKTDRVDFWRATAERGIELALDLNGLSKQDVEILDLVVDGPDYASDKPSQKPVEAFSASNPSSFIAAEVDALLSGKVDAIYSSYGRAKLLEGQGKVKAIEDLGNYPDWTLQVANTPHTITVSAEFAEAHPEIVVAYLKEAIRAGRWINSNHAEAGQIFSKVTSYTCPIGAANVLKGFNFIPNLGAKAVTGIEVEKKFLFEHGYIEKDFDVQQWLDTSFLDTALKELEIEATATNTCSLSQQRETKSVCSKAA